MFRVRRAPFSLRLVINTFIESARHVNRVRFFGRTKLDIPEGKTLQAFTSPFVFPSNFTFELHFCVTHWQFNILRGTMHHPGERGKEGTDKISQLPT